MPGTGDDLKQVRPGDPLRVPAGAYNLLMEVARAYGAGRGKPASAGSGATSPHNSSTILVYNNTGTNVAQYGVLALSTPLNSGSSVLDLFLADLVMNGVTPTATTAGSFAIMLEPTGSNTIGWAAVAGMSQVIIDAGTSSASFTTAESGTTTANLMAAGSTGSAQVIWRQGGTGTQWATVRLSGSGGNSARYAVLTGPPSGNIATGHICTDIAGNGSTTNTVRLNLENPALSAGPTFDVLDASDVVQYLPYSPTIGSGTNQIDGLIVAIHQWPIRGKVGQTPIITADSVGLPVTTRATWNVDYPVLHAPP